MKASRRCTVASSALFTSAIALFCASIANCLGFDGVLVLHLNSDLGRARRGEELTQVIHVINYRLQPITVLFVPTCGCMSTDSGDQVLNAFRSVDVPVTFRVDPQMSGQVNRDVVIVYKIGNEFRRASGEACFVVAQ